LSPSSYVSVSPTTLIQYSVKRLPSTLLDVNGITIANGNSYVVAILVVGTGDVQLSSGSFSASINLLDNQGIYNGDYVGVMELVFA